MRRQASCTVATRNAAIVDRIEVLKGGSPLRVSAGVGAARFTEGLVVNSKRILRLMRANSWLVPSNPRFRANRMPTRSKSKPHRLIQWWGIDMTKVLVESER